MAKAFFSLVSLFVQNAPFNSRGKLATIWFDEIFLATDADALPNILGKMVADNEMIQDTADHLLSCWLPAYSLKPDLVQVGSALKATDRALVASVVNVTKEFTRREYPGVDPKRADFLHEVAWAAEGLALGISNWSSLNEDGGCVLLANQREAEVVNEVFGRQNDSGFEAFSAVADARIPDLTSISWERILELRHHPHLTRFRAKLSALESHLAAGTAGDVADALSDLELGELRRLAKSVEPSTARSTVQAIASNFPLPIPVNPISIALGAKDIALNIRRKKEFGWLYFLLDLPS